MLGNPQISKALAKGFKAPLGSTDRKKAQSIISVFSKINPKKDYSGQGGVYYDGKGGTLNDFVTNLQSMASSTPGFFGNLLQPSKPKVDQTGGGSLSGVPSNIPTKTFIFPSVPEIGSKLSVSSSSLPKNYTSTSTPESNTVKDYLKEKSSFQPFGTEAEIKELFKTQEQKDAERSKAAKDKMNNEIIQKGIQNTPYGSAGARTDSLMMDRGSSDAMTILEPRGLSSLNLPKEIIPAEKPKDNSKETVVKNADGSTTKKIMKENADGTTSTETTVTKADGSSEKIVTKDPVTKTKGVDTDIKKVEKVDENAPVVGGSSSLLKGGQSSGNPTTGGTSVGNVQGDTTQKSNVLGSDVDASGKPIGASAEMLSQLFAGTPIEDLPIGKNPEEQLIKLQDLVEKEHRVDEIYKQLTDLQEQSPNIKIEMGDYIRNRDQAVSSIDKMLDEAYSIYASGGLTPEAKARQKTYINMLEGMRANHNQSYAKFLNRGIEQFNNEVSRVQSLYKDAVANANKDFERKGTLLQSDYERRMAEYQELKDAAYNAKKRKYEMTKFDYEIAEMNGSNLNNALDSIKAGEMSGLRTKIQKDMDFSHGKNKDEIDPNADILKTITRIIKEEGEKTQPTIQVAALSLKRRIESLFQDEGANEAISEINNKWVPQIIDTLTSNDSKYADIEAKENMKAIGVYLLENVTPLVRSHVLSDLEKYKNTFSYLSPKERWLRSDKPALSRDAFISIDKRLSPILLASIYDGYHTASEESGKMLNPTEYVDWLVTKGSESGFGPEMAIANKITKGYKDGIISRINAQKY